MKTIGFFSIVLLLGIISCNSGNETSQATEQKIVQKSEKLHELSLPPVLAEQDTLADSLNTVIAAQDPNSFYWGLIDSATGKVIMDYKYHYIHPLEGKKTFLIILNHHLGLIDRTGKVMAEPYHTNINYLQNGYIEMECYSGKGLFNSAGNQLFPYQHSTSYNVLPTLNRVAIDNGQYGALMDLNGKAIIPFDSHYTAIRLFPEGVCVAYKRVKDNHKAAIFDLNGKMIYPLIFDQVGDFKEGRMMVKRNKEYGFLDEKANIVFYREYDRVDEYYNGFAKVLKNNKIGFLNKEGKEVVPLNYFDAVVFSEGYAPVRGEGYKYGFVDTNGRVAVPFKYQGAECFQEGIAFVHNTNGKYGVINYKGEEIIPVNYRELQRRKNIIIGRLDSTSSIFDFKGKELARFKCDHLSMYYEGDVYIISINGKMGALGRDFKVQLPIVYDALEIVGKNALFARKDTKAHFIDFNGNVISPIEFTYFEGYDDGVAKITMNEKYGLINLSKKLVTPIKYDYIADFEYGMAITERKEKFGLLDYSGKEILPPIYDNITVTEHEIVVEKNGESFNVDRAGKRLEDEGGC